MTRQDRVLREGSCRLWALLCCCVAVVTASPTRVGAQVGEYEDYPKTRGQVERFRIAQLPAWLQFDGELRGRLEGQTAVGTKKQDFTYGLSRVRGGVRVSPIPAAQLYMQFQDAHALGLPLSDQSTNMHDTFDLFQGYMQLQGGPVKLTAGRQVLRFGSERVIGVSDFTNNARSFDGFDLQLGTHKRVDIFTTSVVAVHPSALDTHGAGLNFHGIYGQFDALMPDANLQPFLLFSEKRDVVDGRGSHGTQNEVTFGTELSGSRFSTTLQYDALLALQRGSYASQSISAGAGYIKLSYAPPRWAWAPRIGGEFDYASGGSNTSAKRSTYDQQYPSDHNAFGLVDLFGFQNIRQERINVDVQPSRYLTVLAQAGRLHLASRDDAIYSSSGMALVHTPSTEFSSSLLGTEADVSAKYLFRESVVFNIGIGHLFAPPALWSGLPSKTLGYASLTYRFSLSH